ncbi:MAG TPA: hypothetical protein VFQ48_05955, partial [Pseudonocardiaceae bacterium]|nr:hypothetical protein [Pseudonocardiaceae bacterium]
MAGPAEAHGIICMSCDGKLYVRSRTALQEFLDGTRHPRAPPDGGADLTVHPGAQAGQGFGGSGGQCKGLGVDPDRPEGDAERLQLGAAVSGYGDDPVDVGPAHFVGEPHGLHGQMQPLRGDPIEHRQRVQRGRVLAGECTYGWLVGEGDVPGVETSSRLPAWSPPPMVTGLRNRARQVLDLLFVVGGQFSSLMAV